jgi:hypothetical protein
MKVLLITKGAPDYQSDCLLHGLYHVFGEDFTHSCEYPLMYRGLTSAEDLYNTHGRGFTIWNNLPVCFNDNNDLENKIKNRYYDYIIYGSHTRCLDYIDIVNKFYDRNKVAFIDGEDGQGITNTYNYLLFKRELHCFMDNVHPISFAIPHEKLTKEFPDKEKRVADYTPNDNRNYTFTNEEEYYNSYKMSTYGFTRKKAGWDCMRHYEILANNCIPYFENIDQCPAQTLANFPKKCILLSNSLFEKEDDTRTQDITNFLFEYTKNNLTTIHLAKYVINTMKKYL